MIVPGVEPDGGLTTDESINAATLAAAAWPNADAFCVFVKLTPSTISLPLEETTESAWSLRSVQPSADNASKSATSPPRKQLPRSSRTEHVMVTSSRRGAYRSQRLSNGRNSPCAGLKSAAIDCLCRRSSFRQRIEWACGRRCGRQRVSRVRGGNSGGYANRTRHAHVLQFVALAQLLDRRPANAEVLRHF